MRRPSRRSWSRWARSSRRPGSRSRSPVVRTASHFACWPIAGPARGEDRLTASPSTTACARNRARKPRRCGAGSRPAVLLTEPCAGPVLALSQGFKSKHGPRDSHCSPAGAGERASSTCCSDISEEDQAETVLQRLVRGSGIDGLAAMAPVRLAMDPAGGGVRLLRPLLPAPRDALMATLARWDQPWIDDPTNRDIRHARPRLAAALMGLESEGLSTERLAKAAARAAGDRSALDELCTDLLASCALPSPAGFVILDLNVLRRAPPALAVRALGCVVTTVSGGTYPPRQERLERLARRLLDDGTKAATLGGCRVVPQRDGRVVVCREPSAASEVRPFAPGDSALWDGRFVVSLRRSAGAGPFLVRRLGTEGLAQARAIARRAGMPLTTDCIPAPARPALPALFDLDGPLAAPHLGYKRISRHFNAGTADFSVSFRPARPMAPGLPATLRVLPLQDEDS